MFTVTALAALLLAVASLLPLSRAEHWLVRSMDFPRLQLATLATLLIALQIIFAPGPSVGVALVIAGTALVLGYQLWWILPYSAIYPVEVQPARAKNNANRIRLVCANVLTPNRGAAEFVELIRACEPDVVLTLESDQWWQEQLACLESDYPYSVKQPLDNLYGMHLYSRLALHDPQVEFLVEDNVPSIHTGIDLPDGTRIQAHFLHPAPPSPTENTLSRERDAELVLVARSLQSVEHPIIVAGDLNDVAWSATTRLFRRISGLLDPRVGRGLLNTFHAKVPIVRWPLDHIFVSAHFTLGNIRRLPPFGSDHFAIFTEVYYEPDETDNESQLELRSLDRQWANEKLDATDAQPQDVPHPAQPTDTAR